MNKLQPMGWAFVFAGIAIIAVGIFALVETIVARAPTQIVIISVILITLGICGIAIAGFCKE